MRSSYAISILSALVVLLYAVAVESRSFPRQHPHVQIIPNVPSQHPVTAQWISTTHTLDNPKLSAVNETSGEWWYFDVASAGKANLVIVFYSTTNITFPLLGPIPSINLVSITGTFENGTEFGTRIPATNAITTSVGDGTSGVWEGTGVSWAGTPDMSGYIVTINNPEYGVKGSLTLKSVAPGHYPCGPDQAGEDMRLSSFLAWAVGVPDAVAHVDFEFEGVSLVFDGIGYHDLNWVDDMVFTNVATWYWGHAHFGPYSLTFLDIVHLDGSPERVSVYVAKNGVILGVECAAATARPYGANSEFPPLAGDGNPTGWIVTADLGSQGVFEAKLATRLEVAGYPALYSRVLSDVLGGFKGKTQYSGIGMNEQFTSAAS